MKNILGKVGMVVCVGLLAACADPGAEAANASASDSAPAAAQSVDGLTFTISGPLFPEPATFEVPGDTRELRTYLSDSMFSLTVSPNDRLRSTDGKHVLTGVILGTQPAGVGESTESAGVSEATFNFDTDAGTDRQQGPSMAFSSKGVRQPMRIVMETYEDGKRAAGHFSGKLQRTNIDSTHEIYDVEGKFDVN
ncbi:hypothetical protein [Novilysobacter antarcticus]|uniref:hypothetical protein n=1 Tax=Novilysobacter antarcticus TaxID=2862543 RepID=UPI001C9A0B03|nr:hypothetical protein [Lysobacter antarcticus]